MQQDVKINWLEKIIIEAIDKNWCLKAGCTTCGAMEFRKKLSCYNHDHWDWRLYRVHLKTRDKVSNIQKTLNEIKLPQDEEIKESYKKAIKIVKSDLDTLISR